VFSYAFKRVARSLGFFAALLLGIVLASTFFAGVNIGADTTAKAALNQRLSQVLVDITVNSWQRTSISSNSWITIADRVSSVNNVMDTEVISRVDFYEETFEKNHSYFKIVGIKDNSMVYDCLNVTPSNSLLQKNETYVWINSENADELQINDVLTFNYTFQVNQELQNVSLKLKVAGFVTFNETTSALIFGQYRVDGGVILTPPMIEDFDANYGGNLLIVSWERTIAGILDEIQDLQPPYNPITTEVLVFINRETVINPWDVEASLETVDRIVQQINNQVAEYDLYASSNLQSALSVYQFLSIMMRVTFLVSSLPVFFVAWYVGTTVADVSLNLRRREIGLLLAKGFSSRQLFRLFLLESLLIGIFGGLIGMGLSFLLSPYFVVTIGSGFVKAPVLTLDVVIMTIIFSTVITLLSTFKPSRKAAKLSTVDALREYMYVEEIKPYKQKWPWIAFFLGSYKITMYLIGIPILAQYFAGRSPSTTNIFLTILLGVWIIIDSILTYIGPLLFLWGFTKIFIRGSLAFQELVTRVAKFLGDLGSLATKNVRRNPARAASVAFLVALIIGYGFQTIGTLASEEDYVVRQVKAGVGADLSISLVNIANTTAVSENVSSLQGIASVTPQYSLYVDDMTLVAVNPQEWLSTAYFENEWFTGNIIGTAFQELSEDNSTIILEHSMASQLELDVGDFISLRIGSSLEELRVVGFFGPETNVGQQPVFNPPSFWSYISIDLYSHLDDDLDVSKEVLVKLEPNMDGTIMASQIQDLNLNEIISVNSVSEQFTRRESDLLLSGTVNIQRIGVFFAVTAAAVASALVALVSLQERKKEITIMNVRGFSFKQLIKILLAENLAIVVFAVALGAGVGLILIYGNIVALNTQYVTLVVRRMVFPLDATLILSSSVILVFASSILPIIAVTKRYISKLERIVRA
jgi:ABC-type lipoprotein release transport system permease subunit